VKTVVTDRPCLTIDCGGEGYEANTAGVTAATDAVNFMSTFAR